MIFFIELVISLFRENIGEMYFVKVIVGYMLLIYYFNIIMIF